MKTSKLLVASSTGRIGSHTAVGLIERGYKVTVIDNLSKSERNIRLVQFGLGVYR